ncbi:pentatricopeptide repeat domain-containing protein [Colletotrichum higginsianum]|uniref:Pentatricopeptide repeat domain-containing protein n=2 Tax=Colletotrichum higginsianum TaxID=80884 RepID=H1VFD6_COLHI|nr:Pentatricopeptide repeat domain-containing protein [Colletotrichum higginsianum IMI 349063]OBR07389.1 Pentatricopeptide repeat domain-containing protein [Colletotrichum higginsianum IMI 349063]TIC92497.1 Complex I intermediate-associated protein 84, mitochondrial [Colletotrichum higginsianum]CCF38939.1 pentatricopeptide repeat domain-containing protein [Colletotrichum higginsianum]
MRAQIARHVSRRVLIPNGCVPACSILSRPACRRTQLPVASTISLSRRTPRRTFFGILQKPPRQIKKPEYEPGWPAVLTWRNHLLESVRPPARTDLVQALRDLFGYKLRYNVVVNSTQALHCRNLLRYLVENKDDEPGPGLTLADLTTIREALLKLPKEDTKDHLEFSRLLYDVIKAERALDPTDPGAAEDFESYLVALTLFGASTEALAVLQDHWTRLPEAARSNAQNLWVNVLQGLAEEGHEAELVAAVVKAEEFGLPFSSSIHEVITVFYAKKDNVLETKKWFLRPILNHEQPSPRTFKEILHFSVRTNQRGWTAPIFKKLVDANPSKGHWDVIYQWAVLSMGKGLDDIKGMFDVVARYNPDDSSVLPDTETINGLLEVAIEKNDPYLADRLVSFSSELGIRPDATTYLLQMDFKIRAKDLAGARAAYMQLPKTEVSGEDDLPLVNRYLQALCYQTKLDFKAIREMLDILEERVATLDPETVVALCTVFLKNDQQFEVMDTLSLNVFQHSNEQRRSVRDAFVAYCLDKKNSTARVWDAYSILRQYFQETSVESRVQLMNAFFDRNRPDMAIHVFGHMRQHVNPTFHPTSDVYVQCFEGMGRCPDLDSLGLVHNMLKMDTKIQPSTKMFNALMIAYGACQKPSLGLEFWQDIVRSAEGPSYNSLEIVFFLCEIKAFGDQIARDIWNKIEKMEIDVPPAVFAAYCGGLAGNGNLQEVQSTIRTMKRAVGYGPDAMTLGIPFNALPGQGLQRDFEAWAKKQFPEEWAEVEKFRYYYTAEKLKRFKLQRVLKA